MAIGLDPLGSDDDQDPLQPNARGFTGFTGLQRQNLRTAINADRGIQPKVVSFSDPNSKPWPSPPPFLQHPDPQQSPFVTQPTPQAWANALRNYDRPQGAGLFGPGGPFSIGGIFGPSLGAGGGTMAGINLGADPVIAAQGMLSL